MGLEKYLEISKEVKEAIDAGLPVVALESTVISHGIPYPKNVEAALKIEQVVRDNQAIPATVAIINGKIKVGCSKAEIEYLGKKGQSVCKVSRRDLPIVLAKKMDGSSTVATTMIAAAMAKVRFFATGGIGGVHRKAEVTMDISADLEELAETGVLVVCAGVKSILDIGLTLEYLETKGVPVVGYQTNEMPAFFTRKSGFQLEYSLNTPAELAEVFRIKLDCGLKGGVVVANPIPYEHSLNAEFMNKSIDQALIEADKMGITGKDVTPFLLNQMQKLTAGESLAANAQIIYNNAKLAAEIAREFTY